MFKKQRLQLNPIFLEPEVSNIAYLHGIKDEPITVMDLQADVNSVASYESVGVVDSFSENKFVDTTKAPAGDSDYECFTTIPVRNALHLQCICLMT
jgi:hypothetical protein